MFLTKNFICFYSKIITHETILIIRFNHINSITKSMQFLIFPTQIRIETRNSTYSFTSFRSRSNTLDHLSNLLLQCRQREADNIEMLNNKTNMIQNEQLNKTIELFNKNEVSDPDAKFIEETYTLNTNSNTANINNSIMSGTCESQIETKSSENYTLTNIGDSNSVKLTHQIKSNITIEKRKAYDTRLSNCNGHYNLSANRFNNNNFI